jgi:hypothetical protein
MTEARKQSGDAGSEGTPQRENTGVPELSRPVSQTDHAVPEPEGTGPANDELEWAKKHMPGRRSVYKSVPQSVFRKTELHGIAPPSTPGGIKKARQRTMKNIRDPDSAIAYRPFEDAFRDFTCSLVERQDRVYDEMLLHVADLHQQIDMLECRIAETRRVSSDGREVKG